MATISSLGVGSGGLDTKSIVAQLVALEKAPLVGIQLQAATVNARISAFGQIKSFMSTLSDAATTLSSLTTFNAVTTTSSDNTVVTATATGGTAANSFSVKVDSLAKAQSTASAALLPVGGALGAGTLRLQLGKWTVSPASFTPQAGVASVDITVSATDTVNDVASKINGAGAGVTATVLNDVSGQRLLLRSTSTGQSAGFQLTVPTDADGNNADASGLSRLVVGSSMQAAQDAQIEINGIAVTSSTNTFADVVSGVTLTAVAPSTSTAQVDVSANKGVVTDAINKFVAAYNKINALVNDLTKYDPASKATGMLQGDSTAIGLQNAMRGILQSTTSGSAYSRLADIGITQQLGGDLEVDAAKLTTAMANGDEVKKLFKNDNGNTLTNGVAMKFASFTQGLLATDGLFSSKDAAFKRALDINAQEQVAVNAKAAQTEKDLTRRYSALDVQLSSLSALSSFVTQQVAQWSKTSG
jgi:flagellar hook-associated protein 2